MRSICTAKNIFHKSTKKSLKERFLCGDVAVVANVAGFVVSFTKVNGELRSSTPTIPKCNAAVAVLYDLLIAQETCSVAMSFPIGRKFFVGVTIFLGKSFCERIGASCAARNNLVYSQ